MGRLTGHFRFIVDHPAYRGVHTWKQYVWWMTAVALRKSRTIDLTPYDARVVVPPDLRGVARLLYLFGALHEPELPLLRQLVRPGDTVVDIGAHYGSHSVILASLVGSEGRVIALEPLPRAFAVLEESIAANSFDNIEAHQVAAGREEGSGTVVPHRDPSRTRVDSTAIGGTPITTVDSLGLTDVRFMKIDTEGSEDAVLAGASMTLQSLPTIMVETSTGNGSLPMLREKGYRIYRVDAYDLVEVHADPTHLSNVICLHPEAGRTGVAIAASQTAGDRNP